MTDPYDATFNEALHGNYDENHWPKTMVRHNRQPWADGVVYLQFDRPNHAKGVRGNGTIAWEFTGQDYDFDRFNQYSWHRYQCSPLYAYTLAIYHNGLSNKGKTNV